MHFNQVFKHAVEVKYFRWLIIAALDTADNDILTDLVLLSGTGLD